MPRSQRQSGITRTRKADQRWLEMAQAEGFANEYEMLSCLYKDQSQIAIGDLLGYTSSNIGHRLRKYGIAIRGRGGPNNKHGRPRKQKTAKVVHLRKPKPEPRCECGGKLVETDWGHSLCFRCGARVQPVKVEREQKSCSTIINRRGYF